MKEFSSPEGRCVTIENLINGFNRLTREVKPYGLYDPNCSFFNNPGGASRFAIPLNEFSERRPYNHLIEAINSTMAFVSLSHLKRKVITLNREIINQHELEDYERARTFAKGGISIMGMVLELIPVLHERQFPDENPAASELGDIARSAYPIIARLAGVREGIAIPMVHALFGVTTVQDYIGILENWKIVKDSRTSNFEIVDGNTAGRKLVTKKDWNTLYEIAKSRRGDSQVQEEKSHCPALDIRSQDGDNTIKSLWGTMINIAERWHYVHTIQKIRERKKR